MLISTNDLTKHTVKKITTIICWCIP